MLAEFADEDFEVFVVNADGAWRRYLAGELWPLVFNKGYLEDIPSDELRWQVGRELEAVWRQHRSLPGFLRGLQWLTGHNLGRLLRFLPSVLFGFPRLLREGRDWNPAVYILTEEEKLIARQILLAEKHSCPAPSAAEMAAARSLPPEIVTRGLAMLARLGFLAPADGAYALVPDHERFSRGLGFNFHTVTLANGEVFNVP